MNTPEPITVEITMKKDKECKHSIRFSTDDPKARVSNVYVSRAMPGIEDAAEIVVTVAIKS